jgi:hypothetical protein
MNGLVATKSHLGVTLDDLGLEVVDLVPPPEHGCVGKAELFGTGDLVGVPAVDAREGVSRSK